MASMAVPQKQKKDMKEMPLWELQDLLRRQEQLVGNKAFVNKLPDKGAKIFGLIERCKMLIKSHQQVDETADLFQQMAIKADDLRKTRFTEEEKGQEGILGAIINQPAQEKVVVDERDPDEILLPESYIRIIKEPNKENVQKERFIPNRPKAKNRKTTDDGISKSKQRQPESSDTDAPAPHTLKEAPQEPGRKLKYRYDDSLEDDMSHGKSGHDRVRMISIEESVQLLREQKKKQEECQAKQAMERLAQRLGVKTVGSVFDPEGSRKLTYREKEDFNSDDEDTDSDEDDAKERDYPDEKPKPVTTFNSRTTLPLIHQRAT